MFRCDDKTRAMNIHRGFSRDAIHWESDPKPLEAVVGLAFGSHDEIIQFVNDNSRVKSGGTETPS